MWEDGFVKSKKLKEGTYGVGMQWPVLPRRDENTTDLSVASRLGAWYHVISGEAQSLTATQGVHYGQR